MIKKGSVTGAILLLAGSAIGGGMLGLPIITGLSGFYPATSVLVFCWIFMTITALLLLEVNLSFNSEVNLITMTYQRLGQWGKTICWCTYLFLFYCMLVAYIDVSGSLTEQFINQVFKIGVSSWQGSLFFTVFLGIFVFLGTSFTDYLNRIFMVGLIVTYIGVIAFGAPEVDSTFFKHKLWGYSLLALPIAITSFGYHNILPTLAAYLKNDRKRLIYVIIGGGILPLVVYILWDWLLLGVIPEQGFQGNLSYDQVLSFVQSPIVKISALYFAFFAIITSFLAQALALLDFLRDALRLKNNKLNRLWLCAVVLIPPYIFAIVYPGMFIQALGLVGGFAAIILFVIMPVLMVWDQRYIRNDYQFKIVPGGRGILVVIALVGLIIMGLQLIQEVCDIQIINQIFLR